MCSGSFDCPCDGPDRECPYCSEKELEKLNVSEFFHEVIEQIYGRVTFDIELLEHALSELSGYFEYDERKLPDNIAIEEKDKRNFYERIA